MSPRNRFAWLKELRLWRRIANGSGEAIGPDTSPFCQLYFNKPLCRGCPVRQRTGTPSCSGTPYLDAVEMRIKRGPAHPHFLKAAKAMLDFLKTLNPK